MGLADVYLADLDAIAGQPPDLGIYAHLRQDGFRLWLDAEPAARVTVMQELLL